MDSPFKSVVAVYMNFAPAPCDDSCPSCGKDIHQGDHSTVESTVHQWGTVDRPYCLGACTAWLRGFWTSHPEVAVVGDQAPR